VVQSAIHAIAFRCRENVPNEKRLVDVLVEEKNRLELEYSAASAQRDREAEADRKQKLSEANAKHDDAIGRLEQAQHDLRTQADQLETSRQQLEAQLNAERTRWRQQVAQLEAEFNRDLPWPGKKPGN
jgi:predicted  nucleic acid-binding Zn-ribbon protein